MKFKQAISTAIVIGAIPPAFATTVIIDMAVPQASAVAPPPTFVSTGTVRASAVAPPPNVPAVGTVRAPEVSGPASPAEAAGAPGTAPPSRATSPGATRRQQTVPMPGAAPSAKGQPVQEIVYEDPGAFRFSVEAGYASQHLWRGIDLVQLTSFNHQAPGVLDKADSDVTFLAANASYQGFGFGLKYIRSMDDNLNPFFAPLLTDTDSYEELVLSLNYTRGFLANGALTATAGFDFFYYPNGEFWGVDHQGLLYARATYAAHKWANPFIELFYNVPTTSSGNGLATNPAFRGAEGADLVEGYGAEIGVSGGDQIFVNDAVAVGVTYSTSVFYKQGYAFEDDGFSHLMITLGLPISVGSNVTITPSITYSEAIQDVSKPGAPIGNQVYYSRSSAWNEPGFSAGVRMSWQF